MVEARRHQHVHSFIFMVSKSSEVLSSWARMWRIRLYSLRDSFTGGGKHLQSVADRPSAEPSGRHAVGSVTGLAGGV